MANILILGGGFGGAVAAEQLAQTVAAEHQITLVSRSPRFVFYPALVRLAFGKSEPDDISYDLRDAMLDRRVRFLEGEAARVRPREREVTLAGGDFAGEIAYDHLIYALGRRLDTAQVPGFYEHAHHLLTVEAALRFGEAVRNFRGGSVVVGACHGARLDVPVYETAFALARQFQERGVRAHVRVVRSDQPLEQPGAADIARAVAPALDAHGIELLPNFRVEEITERTVRSRCGRELEYDLLMLLPPFVGAPALAGSGLTDDEGFVRVNHTMRALDSERVYAVGDAVYFGGPKMGHMAVRQAEVAAANLASELVGEEPSATYDHQMALVIDAGGAESLYLRKSLWESGGASSVRRGRFWSWAKRVHERYWQAQHS